MPRPEPRAVQATPVEKRARDELAHEAWGGRLSVAQFVRREERLRATAFARAGMQTWLLVERGDAARRAFASLETFRVPSRHGMRPGVSYEIASVYTTPSLRGRGHASELLRAVARELEPCAQALTLYSDVGAAIYARVGYASRPAFDWVIPAARGGGGIVRSDEPAAIAALLRAPRGRYAIVPTASQIDWHRERERIYAELLGARPVAHGVLIDGDGHALLAGDLKHGRLLVLSLRAGDAACARRLLVACADEAARAELSEVVAWAAPEPDDDRVIADAVPALGGRCVARDGGLPMLRPCARASGLDATAWRDLSRALWV